MPNFTHSDDMIGPTFKNWSRALATPLSWMICHP